MPRTRRAENITLIARRISTSLQSVGEDFAALGRLIEAGMASRTAGPRTRLARASNCRVSTSVSSGTFRSAIGTASRCCGPRRAIYQPSSLPGVWSRRVAEPRRILRTLTPG